MKRIGVNEDNYRVGEGHHRAKLTDEQVRALRDLYELGQDPQLRTAQQIAKHLGLSWHTVRALLGYRRRAQAPRDWREIDERSQARQ